MPFPFSFPFVTYTLKKSYLFVFAYFTLSGCESSLPLFVSSLGFFPTNSNAVAFFFFFYIWPKQFSFVMFFHFFVPTLVLSFSFSFCCGCCNACFSLFITFWIIHLCGSLENYCTMLKLFVHTGYIRIPYLNFQHFILLVFSFGMMMIIIIIRSVSDLPHFKHLYLPLFLYVYIFGFYFFILSFVQYTNLKADAHFSKCKHPHVHINSYSCIEK